MSEKKTHSYSLRASFLVGVQLYNEEVNDLLSPDSTKLQIHESKESGIYVAGLREDIVTSVEHVLQLLEAGERSRHVGETRMNKNSSRSHSIFRMVRAPCIKRGHVSTILSPGVVCKPFSCLKCRGESTPDHLTALHDSSNDSIHMHVVHFLCPLQ